MSGSGLARPTFAHPPPGDSSNAAATTLFVQETTTTNIVAAFDGLSAEVVQTDLLLIVQPGVTLNAGPVIGPPGNAGPQGPIGPASLVGALQGAINAATAVTSEGGTITGGGGGGALGDSYVVATPGTLAVDGIGICGLGDTILRGATKWARVPSQGTTGVFAAIFLPTGSIDDDGVPNGLHAIKDQYGQAIAVFSGAGLAVGPVTTAGVVASGTVSGAVVQGGTLSTNTLRITDDGSGTGDLALVDAFGQAAMTVSAAGAFAFGSVSIDNLTVTGALTQAAASSSSFSPLDIALQNSRSLALAAAVHAALLPNVAAPVWNRNVFLTVGQSLGVGLQSAPPLSTTQPYDNLCLGQGTRGGMGAGVYTWSPLLDANFHPLVAVAQAGQATNGIVGVAAMRAMDQPTIDGLCGESVEVSALNLFRKMWLQVYGLASGADARVFVGGNVAVAGQAIEQLSHGATPNLFGLIPSYCAAVQAAATAAGLSSGLAGKFFLQGENNQGGQGFTGNAAAYQALLAQYNADIDTYASVAVFGQTQLPPIFTYQTGAEAVSDANMMGAPVAQLAQAKLQHARGWTLFGPHYAYTDKGLHLQPNGTRWLGNKLGTVMYRVYCLRQAWLPLHNTAAIIRGIYILLTYHVPVPPLRTAQPYVVTAATTIPNLGITVRNIAGGSTGTVLAQAAAPQLVSDTCILLTLAAAPSSADIAAGNITVWHGDETYSQGCTMITDSEGTLVDDTYVDYTANFPQWPGVAIPALSGLPYDMRNWCAISLVAAAAG